MTDNPIIPDSDSHTQVNNSDDWRDIDLSTNGGTRRFERLIAERLGWHPEYRNGGYAWVKGDSVWTAPKRYNHDAEQVWRHLCITTDLFDYTTDLNSAIELLTQMPMGAVGLLEDGKTWFSSAYMDGIGVMTDEEADTPTLAICRAWLAYTDYTARAAGESGVDNG